MKFMNFFQKDAKRVKTEVKTSGKQSLSSADKDSPSHSCHCGICGKGIDGPSTRRSDLNVYFCSFCGPRYQYLSTHEKVASCSVCGYSFVPDNARWYYTSDEPKCPSCNSSLPAF